MAMISTSMGKGDDVKRAAARVSTALPLSTRPEDVRALEKLNKACGCAEGAVGAVTLPAIILVRFIYASGEESLLALLLLLIELLAAFLIGGFVGKYVGLAIARARVRRLRNRIQQQEARMGAA